MALVLRAAALVALAAVCAAASPLPADPPGKLWAVVVSSSRYWFNYRHSSNALAVYGVREWTAAMRRVRTQTATPS
jgi:glycosylphosphatidylinositol transamidase (GPIT) subunit GPI8